MKLGSSAFLNSHPQWRAQPVAPVTRPPPQLTCSKRFVLSPPNQLRLERTSIAAAASGWHAAEPAPRPLPPVAASAAVTSAGDLPEPGPGIIKATIHQYQKFVGLAGKFMPMVALFFLLAFVNTILDSLKDTLVITAVGGGAQVIPYLTVYAVLPSSLAFLLAYALASQHMSRPALFNAIVTAFMGFFVLFAFVLYPNHATLHPHGMADQLAKVMPQGLEGLVGMFRNWTFTAFFCMSELWGDVCLGLLFWGLANDTTKLADAPTLYPLFGLGANVAQALGGTVLKVFSSLKGHNPSGDFSSEIQALMLVVVGFTVAALAVHAYIDRKYEEARNGKVARAAARARAVAARAEAVAKAARAAAAAAEADAQGLGGVQDGELEARRGSHGAASSSNATGAGVQKEKEKPSVGEIFRVLAASVPIRCLAIMSLAQGLCTSLMEFAWKSHIGLLFPSPTQFTSFLGDVSMWQGLVTGFLMVLSPAMFERMGWAGVAGCTPRVLLFGGAAFFASCLLYQFMFATHAAASLQSAAVTLATGAASAAHGVTAGTGGLVLQGLVYGGALLYVFSKSAKFSLFKPAEEMVYISLDEEGRTKGKAAIDVVGSQAGKSSGSIMQQVLLLISGGAIAGIIPILAIVYFGMAQGWLRSVTTLSAHADYGHPDSVHESVAVLQAATLNSMDEDEESSGGTNHGRGPPKPAQPPAPHFVHANGNGNGGVHSPSSSTNNPAPSPSTVTQHVNGHSNGHVLATGAMLNSGGGVSAEEFEWQEEGVVVVGVAGVGAPRAALQSKDAPTPTHVSAPASGQSDWAATTACGSLTSSVAAGAGRQLGWDRLASQAPQQEQQLQQHKHQQQQPKPLYVRGGSLVPGPAPTRPPSPQSTRPTRLD